MLSAESLTSARMTLGDRIFTCIDGTFTDWKRVIPSAPESVPSEKCAQFNPAYIGDFGKFAAAMGLDSKCATIAYTNYNDPHGVTFGPVKAFGVIMPLRDSGPLWAGKPDWVK